MIARQTAVGGKIQLEHRARRKDGAVIWVSVSAHSADMKGQRVYFASCLDITQSRRNLLEAYEAKRDAELISNSIPGGVIKLRMTDFKLLYAMMDFIDWLDIPRKNIRLILETIVTVCCILQMRKWSKDRSRLL